MSSDFDFLLMTQSWSVDPGTRPVSEPRPALGVAYQPTDEFVRAFPVLDQLLRLSRATELETPAGRRFLIAWTDHAAEPMGWICPAPSLVPHPSLHPVHQLLLRSFGGIGERMNEREDTWLLNLNSALVEKEALRPHAWFDVYESACELDSLPLIVREDDYQPFAFEANGNCTLYHRATSAIIMEAHDHSFDHLAQLPGCPEYSLYSIPGCPDLQAWVDTVAAQWLRHVAGA